MLRPKSSGRHCEPRSVALHAGDAQPIVQRAHVRQSIAGEREGPGGCRQRPSERRAAMQPRPGTVVATSATVPRIGCAPLARRGPHLVDRGALRKRT